MSDHEGIEPGLDLTKRIKTKFEEFRTREDFICNCSRCFARWLLDNDYDLLEALASLYLNEHFTLKELVLG